MTFEFDQAKSESNKAKHGIDFVEAQALWLGDLREVEAVIVGDENRYVVVGRINGKLWAAAITYRGEAVRIISCRRANKKEIASYVQT